MDNPSSDSLIHNLGKVVFKAFGRKIRGAVAGESSQDYHQGIPDSGHLSFGHKKDMVALGGILPRIVFEYLTLDDQGFDLKFF